MIFTEIEILVFLILSQKMVQQASSPTYLFFFAMP